MTVVILDGDELREVFGAAAHDADNHGRDARLAQAMQYAHLCRIVTASVAKRDAGEQLNGSIVCIPNADLGFDWLFVYPIAGLITAWGGVNSHMAIRAGELGLPAVISAGEALYRRWSGAQCLHLDCAGRRVELLA